MISDAPDAIHEKVKHALTDSIEGVTYDPVKRPGVSNLIDILRHVRFESQFPEEIVAEYGKASLKAFKDLVAGAIIHELAPFRAKYQELKEPRSVHFLDDVAAEGSHTAYQSAQKTLLAVRDAIGL